jgi:hypothetical protein
MNVIDTHILCLSAIPSLCENTLCEPFSTDRQTDRLVD